MRSITRLLVLLVLLVCALVPLKAQPETVPAGTVNIDIVLDGPWERNDEILGWTREEIRTLTDGEFEVRFPQDAILVSGQERFGGHTETLKHYALFNEFMVLEALDRVTANVPVGVDFTVS